jgi:hypothetical protein
MAVIAPTYLNKAGVTPKDAQVITWTSIDSADTCTAVEVPVYADMSVQYVCGTWGSGVLTIEGSNDGTNFETLNDAFGAAISKTANGISQILENTLEIKPVITGAGLTGLEVTMLIRRG